MCCVLCCELFDGTLGQDGIDGIVGGVTAVAGMQILGTTTGIVMAILAGTDMTQCYGELNGDVIMSTMHILMAQEAAELI